MTSIIKKTHFDKTIPERKLEVTKIYNNYPSKICIYIDKQDSCKTLNTLKKHKYLSERDMLFSQYVYVIRKQLDMNKETALIFFINGNIPSSQLSLGELYDKYQNDDGFLYITYTGENCFG